MKIDLINLIDLISKKVPSSKHELGNWNIRACLGQLDQLEIRNSRAQRGFTLIELILYITLVSIFLTGAILFSWDVIYGREKVYQQQVVEQNVRAAIARIAYEIRRAENINTVSSNSLQLENGTNDTTISLLAGVIQITTSGAGPYDLTSNQVEVSSLNFADLSSTDENSNSVLVTITARQAQVDVSGQYQAETTMSESVELNSQFNQSRRLLVDTSGGVLSANNKHIEGITIQNTGSSDITIDKLAVSWSDTTGGENITEVQVGGGGAEWTGSQASGSTLDLSDYVLTVNAGVTDVDDLEFDANMGGAQIELEFTFSDESVSKASLSLGASVTPTPTPSPSSCSQYCVNQGYSSGTCRQNSNKCSQNGETHESGGDSFCTGGANADTCCCGN